MVEEGGKEKGKEGGEMRGREGEGRDSNPPLHMSGYGAVMH